MVQLIKYVILCCQALNDLRSDVVVRFVDIDGFVDHQCLTCLNFIL